MVSMEFHIAIRPHYDSGIDSASNRNEYKKYSLGVKAAGAYGRKPYHLHKPNVLKSGSIKLLESSGPVQACNGIALPFHVTGMVYVGFPFEPHEGIWRIEHVPNLGTQWK